jgi:ABC-2 type transport system permease protein
VRRLLRAEVSTRWRSTALLGLGAFAFMLVVAGTYQALGKDKLETFAGKGGSSISAFAGSSNADIATPRNYLAFGFDHPMFLLLTMAVAVGIGAASVAGDVESGRAELLYTRPVARTRILASRVALWLGVQVAVLLLAGAGALVGSLFSSDLRQVGVLPMTRALVAYLPLTAVVAGASFAASARVRTRAAAVAVGVGAAAVGYLVNFVALVWSPARSLRWVSPFGYYEPVHALDVGIEPWKALALLAAAAVLFALAFDGVRRRALV